MMIPLTILCLFFVSSLIRAFPLEQRDVWNPPITSPNANTVWSVGDKVDITWDTSNIPPDSQLTSKTGRAVLGFLTADSENLMLDSPLAQGFPYKAGKVTITVPNVPPRSNYIVVVFGDSGNASPEFSITGGTATSSSALASTESSPPQPTSSTLITAPIPITGSAITGASSSPASSDTLTPTPNSVPPTPTIHDSTQTAPISSPTSVASSSIATSTSPSTSATLSGTSLPASGSNNGATGMSISTTLYYAIAPLTIWALF